ncbi:MAG TPA: hypothetical protein VIM65_03200 [Cyclobacteriaceae bacterium]
MGTYKRLLIILIPILLLVIFLFIKIDFNKITSRVIKGSVRQLKEKSPVEIYSILFQKPEEGCFTAFNCKDQKIPYIDCCIWMEFETCSSEFDRVLAKHSFIETKYLKQDSLLYNIKFEGKPKWWLPGSLGDSILKFSFKRDSNHEQILFSNTDHSHVFCCDRAE